MKLLRLPPDPPIDLSEMFTLLDKANSALGRLDEMHSLLPYTSLYTYVRKEAVLSSKKIKGWESGGLLTTAVILEQEPIHLYGIGGVPRVPPH